PRTVQVDTEANSIENRFVRVDLRGDGSFDLLDKISGGRYEGLNVLEDVPDTGDEYNHASLEPCEPTVSSGVDGSVSVVEQTAFAATLRAQCEIELPISLTDDRKSRSDVSVTCALKMDVSLEADSPLVKIRLLFDNRASDHRLRVRFPTDVTADTVLSDGCFFVDRRPTKVLDRPDWTELPCDSYPQQEFSAVTDGVTGLAVFQKGLHEVAPLVTERGTGVAVTLLRAVGWLSRYDVPARKNRPAGPMLPTPEAQCLGVQRFDYAVMPFQGDVVEGELKRWSALYRVDPLSLQGTFGECDLHGILAVDSADIVVTAIKRHESRESIVVRLCSLVETPTSATVEVGFQVENVWSLDLFENRLHRLHTARHSFDVILGAHEIVSLEITLR
ncbi:MAG: glycosyl hydrolase-related protein, partial [Gemmatimonadota bacterium]|nr:glycosyl hydrolase-related protein [Gemmatimonadota bacterium]